MSELSAPRPGMLSLDDAVQRMLSGVVPCAQAQTVATLGALGRVLAEDVRARADVPPWDNSAMDGYAVRLHEAREARAGLPVMQRVAAGQGAAALAAGSAARVFTGAPLPAGADAVAMQEVCEAVDDGQRVVLRDIPAAGANIRRQGEDMRAGDVVLQAGVRLTPQALGVAASAGHAELSVRRRLRVALLCSGDELAMPGQPLRPGQIYNSNRYTLSALIQAAGFEGTDLGVAPDDLDATRALLRSARAEHDIIISTGGVSVGEEDHLKNAVRAEGELELWQVAIKPGKPLAFGRLVGGTPWVGLPGNPVAAFVTFVVAVRPLLNRLQGLSDVNGEPLDLVADFDWPLPDKRREFLRVRRQPDHSLALYPHQGAAVLSSLHWADGLADLRPGQVVRRGERVRFLPFAGAWPGLAL